ncbi:hypothetical protein LUCX_263 [Xanthomonas phage vB_XciM_LucasX]|nr:hypothetical protein LUCX_263 [Xanthomonas phage vB_XciM_LucasX]
MFKSFSVKVVVASLLALTLSACTSLGVFSSAPVSPVQIQPIQVEALSLAVEAEKIDITPFQIEVPEIRYAQLSDRAYVDATASEVHCMALAIYHEAKGESEVGQAAVGYVILNRIADGRFGSTVCSTVYQKQKGRCQFSWYCTKAVVKNRVSFDRAKRMALQVIDREVSNPIGSSLFFHATYVRKQHKRYANEYRIGGHRFYGSVAQI